MASLYASKANTANKGDIHGEFTVHTHFSSNTTMSSGDVVYACRLPVNCFVTSVLMIPGAAAGGSGVFQVGTSASAEQFLLSATMSETVAVLSSRDKALGFCYSASDAATVRYENVIVTPRSGISAGRWFDLIIKYVAREGATT